MSRRLSKAAVARSCITRSRYSLISVLPASAAFCCGVFPLWSGWNGQTEIAKVLLDIVALIRARRE